MDHTVVLQLAEVLYWCAERVCVGARVCSWVPAHARKGVWEGILKQL